MNANAALPASDNQNFDLLQRVMRGPPRCSWSCLRYWWVDPRLLIKKMRFSPNLFATRSVGAREALRAQRNRLRSSARGTGRNAQARLLSQRPAREESRRPKPIRSGSRGTNAMRVSASQASPSTGLTLQFGCRRRRSLIVGNSRWLPIQVFHRRSETVTGAYFGLRNRSNSGSAPGNQPPAYCAAVRRTLTTLSKPGLRSQNFAARTSTRRKRWTA